VALLGVVYGDVVLELVEVDPFITEVFVEVDVLLTAFIF